MSKHSMKKVVRAGVLVFLVALFLLPESGTAGNSHSQQKKVNTPKERSNSFFEIKYGTFGPASGTLNGYDEDLASSYAVGISLDIPVFQRFSLGPEIAILNLKAKLPAGFEADDSKNLLSGFLIGRYAITRKESQFVLRPGAGIGIGYLSEPYPGIGDTKYLLGDFTIEGGIMVSKKCGFGLEVGYVWGKDSFGTAYEVSTGAIPMIRGTLILR